VIAEGNKIHSLSDFSFYLNRKYFNDEEIHFSPDFHLLRYWFRNVRVPSTNIFEKLRLREKKCEFLLIYNRDGNSGNSVVFFPTITDFFLLLFRCIPDSLFPYFDFCWSATVSFGVFPWSVYIYRRPWSVEACSNVQRYSVNLDYFLLVSKLQKLHKVSGKGGFFCAFVFLLKPSFFTGNPDFLRRN